MEETRINEPLECDKCNKNLDENENYILIYRIVKQYPEPISERVLCTSCWHEANPWR